MANDRLIDIRETPSTRNNWRLAKEELVVRSSHLARIIAYAAAKTAFDQLMSEIPGGPDYSELKKAIKLVEVSGGKKGKESAFSIYVDSKSRRVKKMDADSTLINIQAKKSRRKPDQDVLILEQNSPWTLDTIPFWPSQKSAIITQRKVPKREVERVSKNIKKNRKKVIDQLREAGRRIQPDGPGFGNKIKKNAKAVPDLAMLALSLEFGESGVKAKPIFRRSIGSAKKNAANLTRRFSIIIETMKSPNLNRYKNYPAGIQKISTSKAASFVAFQKRLGF